MTKEQTIEFMKDLKAKLVTGEIDREEFERQRAPIKEAAIKRLFG